MEEPLSVLRRDGCPIKHRAGGGPLARAAKGSIAIAALACSPAARSQPVPVAAPATTAPAPPPAPSARAPATCATTPPTQAIAHGVVVDLAARRAVRTLLDDEVSNEDDDCGVAYEHIDADLVTRFAQEVRAYDVASGRLYWASAPSRCYVLRAAAAGAFCDTARTGEVVLLDRATGAARTVVAAGGVSDVVAIERVGPSVLVLRSGGPALALDAATGAPAGSLALPERFRPVRTTRRAVCGAAVEEHTTTALCFDGSLRVLWSKTLPLRLPPVMADEGALLLATDRDDAKAAVESVVLSLEDGRELARAHAEASSFVRGDDGRIDGLFRAPPRAAMLEPDGRVRWTAPTLGRGDTARAVLAGGTIAVATYQESDSGADLAGFDRATGKLRWRGDVDLLVISHFAYASDVELGTAGGAILVRGRESMQDYLELFDPRTGARLFSTIRGR